MSSQPLDLDPLDLELNIIPKHTLKLLGPKLRTMCWTKQMRTGPQRTVLESPNRIRFIGDYWKYYVCSIV